MNKVQIELMERYKAISMKLFSNIKTGGALESFESAKLLKADLDFRKCIDLKRFEEAEVILTTLENTVRANEADANA